MVELPPDQQTGNKAMAKRKSAALKPVQSQPPDPKQSEREEKFLQIKLTIGYSIVGFSAIAALLFAFAPKSMGLPQVPPAAALGVCALVAFRFVALRKELQRQGASTD